jgi:branched-chain amino acid transport system ATP-binding protein
VSSKPLLELSGVKSGYGDIQVLWDTSFAVPNGAITALVGSNGAGKTTSLHTISGLLKAWGGEIVFDGQKITQWDPNEVLMAGIAHVPEGRRLFKGLSVRDNLLLGAYLRSDRREILKDLDAMYELFPVLKERASQDATTLSGGQQQMCAIARGIMSRPKLLMIDELSLGLAPQVVDHLAAVLIDLNQRGLTILLVEQDVLTAFEIASNACIVETGRIATSGTTKELLDSPLIRAAYLGM